MSPGDQVKHQAPRGAHFYRLVHRTSSGAQRTYPQDSTTLFIISNAPPSLAPGSYDLIFYNIDCQQLDSVGKKVVYSYQHTENPQISLFTNVAQKALPANNTGQDARPKSQAESEADEDEDQQEEELDQQEEEEAKDEEERQENEEAVLEDPEDEDEDENETPFSIRSALNRDRLAAREEARHIRMLKVQQRVDRQAQRHIRSSMYAREVGETHQLNSIMRREVVEANRIASLSNKRGFDELGRYREANAALREDFERNQESVQRSVEKTVALLDFVLEKAAEKLAAPPPPSTDFTGLGQSAIEMGGKVLLALLSKGGPTPAPALAPSNQLAIPAAPSSPNPADATAAKAASPAPATVPTAQPIPATPTVPAVAPVPPTATPRMHPALAKLAAKFSNLGEIELARRMATPDGWRALFDEIGAEMEEKAQGVTEALEDNK